MSPLGQHAVDTNVDQTVMLGFEMRIDLVAHPGWPAMLSIVRTTMGEALERPAVQ